MHYEREMLTYEVMSPRALAPTCRGSGIAQSATTRGVSAAWLRIRYRDSRLWRVNLAEFILSEVEGLGMTPFVCYA